MIAKMLSVLSSRRTVGKRSDEDHAAAAHAFLSREISAARPVKPPVTTANDDPLAEVYAPVEHALKRAGYLRG